MTPGRSIAGRRPRTFRLVVTALLLLSHCAGVRAETPVAERSSSSLTRDLEHENPSVRLEAVDELGRRRVRSALVPLLLRLRKDSEPLVRAHAAEALRQLGDERAVPFLARALTDPDATTRCRAVLALGDLGGPYLLPTIGRMLADPAVVVRAAAVKVEGQLGGRLELPLVLAAERDETVDTDRAVTAAAILSAARLGGADGLRRSLEIAGPDVDRVWFLRAVKARAIAVARDRKQIPWLVTRLRTDVDLRVSEAAAGALATLDAIDDLKAALSIEEPARRRAAVAGIGEIPGAKARSLLIEATRDPSPGIVFEAAAALLGRGEVEAFPLLISLLNADAPVWLGALNELEKRTGLEFGRNPARWAEWYRSRKEHLRFDPKSGRFEGVG